MNPFHNDLANYLENQISSVTLSLGLLLELKALASSSSSSHVPLISGVSASTVEALSKAIEYLSWSDVLVTTQLILIVLSKSILLKIVLLFAFAGSFISRYKTASLKILVLLLLINPGLPAYVSVIKYTAEESKLNSGDKLSQVLQKTHADYEKRKLQNKKQEDQRNQRQLETAKLEGKDKISVLKRLEDKASDDFKKVDNKVEEVVSDAYQILRIAVKQITIESINLFTSILIQFILLPFLYFFGAFTLYKKLLTTSLQNTFLEKIIVIELATVLLIFTITLI